MDDTPPGGKSRPRRGRGASPEIFILFFAITYHCSGILLLLQEKTAISGTCSGKCSGCCVFGSGFQRAKTLHFLALQAIVVAKV